ncbi:MAG TPA: biotin/lipoyl-binding protein [Gemmataceae bacterium]|nr:biotin/lipoyl-binding protein [Gemmataceae bacterium]
MTRSRFITYASVLTLSGLGLSVLMAAKASGEKTTDPAKPAAPANRTLVCLGYVDTQEKVVGLLPDNFPLTAQVTKVLAREGDEVKEGQPLLEFDTEMLKLKVKEAENAIQRAKAEQARAEAAVRAHAVQVNALHREYRGKEKELASKKSELEEAERLLGLGAGNKLQVEAARAAYEAAAENLESARLKWDGLQKDPPTYLVDLAKEGVKQAEIAKQQAEHARDQVRLRAPADGRIIRSFVSEGTMFGMATKEPAFWFAKKGSLIVRAEVSQEFAAGVFEGQVAQIEDEADDSQKWTGKVLVVPNQFLPKRLGNTGLIDIMPVTDERVLECQISIDGKNPPKFGQKVRVKLVKKDK